MKKNIKNYQIEKSCTNKFIIKVLKDNYAFEDISNWSIYMTMKKYYESNSIINWDCALTNPINGEFEISLNINNSNILYVGNYIYNIIATIPNNNVVKIQDGVIRVIQTLPNATGIPIPPLSDDNIVYDGGVI